jgi:hypothetical protein
MSQLEYDLIRPQNNPLEWVSNVVVSLWNDDKLSRWEYDGLINSLFGVDAFKNNPATCSFCGGDVTWQGYCPHCDI